MVNEVKGKRDGLSNRERYFVLYYLTEPTAGEAAVKAGYSPRSANVAAHYLLKRPRVVEALAKAQDRVARRLDISAERVLRELALIGFSNMQDYMRVTADGRAFVDVSTCERDQWAAVRAITVEESSSRSRDIDVTKTTISLHDKRAALLDLGRHLGIFRDAKEAGPTNFEFSLKLGNLDGSAGPDAQVTFTGQAVIDQNGAEGPPNASDVMLELDGPDDPSAL